MKDDTDRVATVKRDLSKLVPAEDQKRRHAYIIVLSGNDTGAIFRLTHKESVIGRKSTCDIPLTDEGVSRHHAKIVRVHQNRVMLEDLESTNGTFHNGERVTSRSIRDGDRFQLGDATLLKFALADEFEENFQRRLHQAAIRDSLTGISNREFFNQHLKTEIAYSSRHGTSLSLLMLDLDHFKQVNDTHGHQAGDKVLETVGAILSRAVRTEDIVARFGGEEFVVLTRGITADQACVLAERLRIAIEDQGITFHDKELSITTSIGVSSFTHQCLESGDDLVKSADRALYQAKQRGRNRVVSDVSSLGGEQLQGGPVLDHTS